MTQLAHPGTKKRLLRLGEAWSGPIRSYSFMVFAWLFDFRAEEAGAGLAIQGAFMVAYGMAFALFLAADRGRPIVIRGLAPFGVLAGLFQSIGLVSGLVHGQEFYAVFRNGFSVFIFATTAYATARVLVSSDPDTLRRILALLCLGYAASSFLIVLLTRGSIDFQTVRFEIIGTSVIAGLGYAALILPFRLRQTEYAALAMTLLMVFLSITRTYVLVALFQIVPVARHFRRLAGPRLVLFAGILLIAIVTLEVYGGQGTLRWIGRLSNEPTGGGGDYTLQTRVSETQYMAEHFLSGMDTFLFGNGMAARTIYWVPKEVGGGYEWSFGFGHNQYVSMLFVAGLVGGLPLLLLQLHHGWRALTFLSAAARFEVRQSSLIFLGAWGSTIVIGNLVSNVLSSAFGSRGFSLWYAVGTGLLLGVQAMFDPINAPARNARPGRLLRRSANPA